MGTMAQAGFINNSKSNQSQNTTINKALANDVNILNAKAIAFFYSGNFDDAIALSDQALSIEPNDLDALNNKALALADMGEYNQAVTLFDQVLAIDPNNTDALDSKRLVIDAMK